MEWIESIMTAIRYIENNLTKLNAKVLNTAQ